MAQSEYEFWSGYTEYLGAQGRKVKPPEPGHAPDACDFSAIQLPPKPTTLLAESVAYHFERREFSECRRLLERAITEAERTP